MDVKSIPSFKLSHCTSLACEDPKGVRVRVRVRVRACVRACVRVCDDVIKVHHQRNPLVSK